VSTTRTSSTDASRRLLAMIALSVLALGGTAATELETTGALFGAEAATTLEGFQVQALCDFDDYTSVQELLGDLGPSVHWGFTPGEAPWTASEGAPASIAPDSTLVCDEGVLPLSAGAWVSSEPGVAGPFTAILVLRTPSVSGSLLAVGETGGPGLQLSSVGSSIVVEAWDADTVPVLVTSALLDGDEQAHVLAVQVADDEVTLWADGATASGNAPAPVGAQLLGLGAVTDLVPVGAPLTAVAMVSELALVPGAVPTSALEELLASATAP